MRRFLRDTEIGKEFFIAFDGHDPWSSAMSFFFAICEIMYIEGMVIPEKWEYHPGMGVADGQRTEEYPEAILWELRDKGHVPFMDLLYAGEVLHRYSNLLRRKGFAEG